MSIGTVLAKTAGVIGLGLVGYDSHIAGKIESRAYEKNHKAENITEHYMDDFKADGPSVVKQHVKKGIFKYYLDENLSGFFTGIYGYARGATSMLIGNIIPTTLALGAVLPIGKKGGKHMFNKFCGVGLVAYGAIFLAQEFFGIGKTK